MERLSTPFCQGLKRYWKRRQYQRLDGAKGKRKNTKMARFGGKERIRSWKIRPIGRLRIKLVSPVRLLGRIQDGCVETIRKLVMGKERYLNTGTVLGQKRGPKAKSYHVFDPVLSLVTPLPLLRF